MSSRIDANTAYHIVDGLFTFQFTIDARHAVSRFPSEWSLTPWSAADAGRVFDMTPQVVIVGADKGGVGKTMVSRTLLDYFTVNAIDHRAFDTETPNGMLKRFYPNKTEMVDLTGSDGQMKVFDTLGPAITVIDIRAGLLSPTLKTLAEIGHLDPAKCKITVLHILGNSQTSIGEVKAITDAIATSRYIAVANRINDTKYEFPAGSLDIPKLDERACESVDALSSTFGAYINNGPSGVLSGYVQHWLGRVFQQYDAAKLNPALTSGTLNNN
jgi:hypothetical protein